MTGVFLAAFVFFLDIESGGFRMAGEHREPSAFEADEVLGIIAVFSSEIDFSSLDRQSFRKFGKGEDERLDGIFL